VAELIFGRGQLNGNSKPVECVLSYENQLKEALAELGDNPNNQTKLIQFKGKYFAANLTHVSNSFQKMGKKNKKALDQPTEEVNEVYQQEEEEEDSNPADDDSLIPLHTKQASFALIYLLFFSFLMFTLPFGAFYGSRHVLEIYFHLDTFQTTCWSVLAAVITVNFVIALYAIFGYHEAKKEESAVNQVARNKTKTN
jgi:Fe2+ transport system protein B